MKVTIDLTGKELVLLYISTGNPEAKAIIDSALTAEKEFKATQPGPDGQRRRTWKHNPHSPAGR